MDTPQHADRPVSWAFQPEGLLAVAQSVQLLHRPLFGSRQRLQNFRFSQTDTALFSAPRHLLFNE
jgi:hypothetical protein